MITTATRGVRLSGLVALGFLAVALLALPRGGLPSLDRQSATDAYAKLPLSFVENRGQTDKRVHYYAQAGGRSFFFTPDKAVLSFAGKKRGMALDLRFLGASPSAKLVAERQGEGTVNYLTGAKRHTGLHTYGQVTYRGLWPGIDLTFKGAAGQLKYEFLVHPGARVSDIGLAYAGASGLSLTDTGALRIRTPLGSLTDAAPRSYQLVGGRQVSVTSRFQLDGRTAYGFTAGAYDRSRPLLIDPGLAYSTYLGGATSSTFAQDQGDDIAVDATGNAYVAGTTRSPDFPTTPGAYHTALDGTTDGFVTKLNPDGTGLVYSTFLHGAYGYGILLDAAGNAYLSGSAGPAFETTPGAYDTTPNGESDAFVAKLNASGSALIFSTFLGGSGIEDFSNLTLDDAGNIYLAGGTTSTDLPATAGAYDTTFNGGGYDAFAAKLSPDASTLIYATYLGGSNWESTIQVDVDAAGNAYVAGSTQSSNYPTTPGAFDRSFGGYFDGFVTKLNSDGSALLYSTLLGGSSGDQIFGLEVDDQGSAYVTGPTGADYPTTPGAFDTTFNSRVGDDVFVTKLNPAGSGLVYSTFIGGSTFDQSLDLTLDGRRNAYVTGYVESADFPVTPNAFDSTHNDQGTGSTQDDVFVTVLNAAGSRLLYSTYLGGLYTDQGVAIGIDAHRDVYVTGHTVSPNFPTSPGAYDTSLTGNYDAFVTKLAGVTAPSYTIPAIASQLSVALVPTFKPCGTSGNPTNSSHSPPLSVGSCNPPRPGGVARIGALSGMSAALTAVPGDHVASNGDQADVTVSAAMSDVTTTAGSDYAPNAGGPDMTLYARVRLTDVANGTSAEDPGTTTDFDLATPVECTATLNTGIGSDCSASTTADAVTPGLIREDKSTVLQTFRLRVNDSGLDGIRGNSDDAIFATQGVFVP